MTGTELLKKVGNCSKIIALLEKELLSFEDSYENTNDNDLKEQIRKINCEIDKEITKQAVYKIKAYELIKNISDETIKWILIYHYICLLTVEETAERLNYSPRHLQRLLSKASKLIDAQYKDL